MFDKVYAIIHKEDFLILYLYIYSSLTLKSRNNI